MQEYQKADFEVIYVENHDVVVVSIPEDTSDDIEW